MHTRPMSHAPSVQGKRKDRKFLSPEQRVMIRELNDKLLHAARDVKPQTEDRDVFDRASAGRFSPVTPLVLAVDQLLRTNADTDDIAAIFEHGAAMVRARRGARIAPPVVEALLAETRAECIENAIQAEVIADPTCPVKRRRLITVFSNSIAKTTQALSSLLNAEHRGAA